MAAGRWMAECFATTTHFKHPTHFVRQPGKEVAYTNFYAPTLAFNFQNTLFSYNAASHCSHRHKPVRTNTLDKLMNSARGEVLDKSGSCFTIV